MIDNMKKSIENGFSDIEKNSQYISWDKVMEIVPGIVLILIPIILRKKIASFIVRRLEFILKKARFNQTALEEFSTGITKPLEMFGFLFAVIIGNQYFGITSKGSFFITVQDSLSVIIVFWLLHASIILLSDKIKSWHKLFSKSMVNLFLRFLRMLVIFLAVAAVLELWGIKVAPILAGLGLFGVAVALGAQDLFKNLIAGILVIAEKRFEKGDWIKVDGVVEGTVEEIGFRSTKVVRFDKAPVFVPNTKLSENVVTNFSRMPQRRIMFKFGVLYSTNVKQLKAITDKVHQYIIKDNRFNTADLTNFVRIESFNDSSIDIMVYCFTEDTAWVNWLEAREDLIFNIKEIVAKEGSDFAFPSKSIYLGDDEKEIFQKMTKNAKK